MFLAGLQSSHFRDRIKKHDTETVKATLAAIKKVLPKYQESIAMDMVPFVKSSPPTRQWWKHVSLHLLQLRQQLAVRRSTLSNNRIVRIAICRAIVTTSARPNVFVVPTVLQSTSIGTKPSASIDEWQARKDKRQQANAVVAPTTPDPLIAMQAKFDAVIAANVAMSAEIVQLKEALNVKNKLKILDSGANTSIIADITHVDTNTVPFCCRAEDGAGVETASGAVMPITSRGVICGLEGPICPSATTSLLSVPQLVRKAVLLWLWILRVRLLLREM